MKVGVFDFSCPLLTVSVSRFGAQFRVQIVRISGEDVEIYQCPKSGNNCIIQMTNSVVIASRGFVPEKLTQELISQFLNIDEIRDKNLFLTFEVAEICGDFKV